MFAPERGVHDKKTKFVDKSLPSFLIPWIKNMRRWNRTKERIGNENGETESLTNSNEIDLLPKFDGRLVGQLARKLTPPTRKLDFAWSEEAGKTFQLFNLDLFSDIVVQPYSIEKPFAVTTDASEFVIGGVLPQEGHPAIYDARKLPNAERIECNIEKLSLAVVYVVTRLKLCFFGRHFI